MSVRKLSATAGILISALALAVSTGATSYAAESDRDGAPAVAGMLACYDTSRAFVVERGYRYYPKGETVRTTTACADVNLWANVGVWVRVCFVPNGQISYCQADYRWAPAGQWTAVATGVLDGTKFQLHFRDRTEYLISGRLAA